MITGWDKDRSRQATRHPFAKIRRRQSARHPFAKETAANETSVRMPLRQSDGRRERERKTYADVGLSEVATLSLLQF